MSQERRFSIHELLNEFEALSAIHSAGIPLSWQFGDPGRPHLVITSIIHGDEIGPLPAIYNLIKEISKKPAPTEICISFALGNFEAAKIQKRYVEKDLNRIFDFQSDALDEGKRARELASLIEKADLYLDFHQTMQASLFPFYVMASHKSSAQWARLLEGIDHFLTQPMEESFSPGAKCSDEFAQEKNIPALSIECWKKGFLPEAEKLTQNLIKQAITYLPQVIRDPMFLENESHKKRSLQTLGLFYRHISTEDGDQLHPGFQNFQEIKQGQSMGVSANGKEIRSPHEGYLFFPKYSEKSMTMRDCLFVLARKES